MSDRPDAKPPANAAARRKKVSPDEWLSRAEYYGARAGDAEGNALLSRMGDKAAIRRLAGDGAVVLGDLAFGRPLQLDGDPGVSADWLSWVLGRIAAGEAPNQAFGWTRPAGAAPAACLEAYERRAILIRDARKLKEALTHKSSADAAQYCATLFRDRLSESKAKTAIETITGRCDRLTAADAGTVAAQLIATHSAANDPHRPWGRYSPGALTPEQREASGVSLPWKRLEATTIEEDMRRYKG